MECPNGSYITQFLHKYVHMFSCPGILSSYIFLFSYLSFSVQKMCTDVRVCVDVAMPLLCSVLFLLISMTNSGTQSVNDKDRRQKLINVKLIYYIIT